MLIAVLSDTHLELNPDKQIAINNEDREVDVLILAGDIGNPFSKVYCDLIFRAAANYKYVIVIAGNHEYYQLIRNMDEVENQIAKICNNYDNVHYLNRKSVILDDVRFVGCTLWSVPDHGKAYMMNDFARIYQFTPNKYYGCHKRDRDYLRTALEDDEYRDYITVVVTHHLPSFKMINPKFEGSTINTFYANNLDELINYGTLWIAGHSHAFTDMNIDGCRCVVNPLGYSSEETGYKEDLVLEI